ncbi:MAG: glycosyltransferase family 4 protein [Cyanobacteria bacterium J06634_5]
MTSTLPSPHPKLSASSGTPKILVVTRTFLPAAGGIEDYVYSRCLQEPDNVAVLSAACPGDKSFDAQQTFPVYRWPMPPLPKVKGLTGILKQIIYLIWEFIQVIRLTVRDRYAVVEWCHGYDFLSLLLISYLLPVRCCLYLHGNDLLCPLRNPLLRSLFALTLNRMDRVVCNSHFTQGYLKTHFKLSVPTVVINPTVRPEKFGELPTVEATQQLRQTYSIPAEAIILLSVGRLVPRKGFETIIALMPELIEQGLDIHYLICGKGKQKSELVSLTAQLGLTERVHFAGYVPDSQLAAHYLACDIFALPTFFNASDQSIEGYGIVYAEAGYFGKPVIACDVGGVADAVKHNENGLMISPNHPEELPKAIRQLCQDPELRARLGKRGRALALRDQSFKDLYATSGM